MKGSTMVALTDMLQIAADEPAARGDLVAEKSTAAVSPREASDVPRGERPMRHFALRAIERASTASRQIRRVRLAR